MEANLSIEALRIALQAWPLPEPLTIRPLPGGMTGEVWQIEAGDQHFVAKYAYTSQPAFEGGLYAAELVEQHGIACGIPLLRLLCSRKCDSWRLNPTSNAENLKRSRQELESSLANL